MGGDFGEALNSVQHLRVAGDSRERLNTTRHERTVRGEGGEASRPPNKVRKATRRVYRSTLWFKSSGHARHLGPRRVACTPIAARRHSQPHSRPLQPHPATPITLGALRI
jgi:hypothetical protein